MIITMITMGMMQSAVYKIVDMVTMRHRLMSAVWTVRVRAVDLRRALQGICCADRDDMFIHVILVHVVEMAIVQIVHMTVVANRSVSAVRAMRVSVVGVVFLGTCGHWCRSLRTLGCPSMPHQSIE
ncbi:hypothetical protein [Bradyrhizobium erythrophlei]|uniref:hypothetical protein n=1 Tax=Bradyrhizobium erythrophlei TaxID=1437360 RepID=UPI00155F9F0B|nr:hypothetical protein [Bradyrhizobium erythrophlei]